ncbi:ATP-binding protein [Pseudomonas putida]
MKNPHHTGTRWLLAWLTLLCLAFCGTGQAAQSLPFALMPAFTRLEPLTLPASDRVWLNQRGTLRVGVSITDHEPVDITVDRNRYRGISADYLNLIASRLDEPLQIHGFARREEAVEALENGEIDILTSANGFERKRKGLAFTRAYMPDDAVLVQRQGVAGPVSMDGTRIAVLDGYLNLDELHGKYPRSEIILAPSLASGLEAVAQGEVQAFIGNEVVVRAYNALRPFMGLRIAGSAALPNAGFAFAVRDSDPALRAMLDRALASIDESLRREILGRWTAGLGSDIAQPRVALTDEEQAWRREHPRVRVIASDYPPYLYRDRQGNWVGLGRDVLATISSMSGLQFDFVPSASIAQSLDALRTGKADMNTTLSENTERRAFLAFSHSFGGQGWVLVVRGTGPATASLDDMAGRVLALPRQHALESTLRQEYPRIRLHLVDTYDQARDLVRKGEADATLDSEVSAWRSIGRYPPGELKVGRSLEGRWASDRFAVRLDEPLLLSILNKSLEAYPVAELRAVRLKWLGAVDGAPPVWQRIAPWVWWALAAALLFGVVSLMWNSRLKAQIHQRQRAEQALNDQLAFQRALLDGIPNPIYVRDLQGRMVLCNKSYETVFATRLDQVKGKLLPEVQLIPSSDAAQLHADYLKLLDDQQPLFVDRQIELGGQRVDAWQWMVPFYRADGQLQGMLGGWVDISERKRLEAELVQASQAKSAFLATMSHEIRTPMAAIIGLLELEREMTRTRGGEPSQAIDVAYQSARDLIALIGDSLDLAKIESGSLHLAPEATPLRPFLETIVQLFSAQASHGHVRLALELAADADGSYWLDPLRLRQVIHNLLSNALKFTHEGAVVLSVGKAIPQGLCIEVRDTGVGIDERLQARLFKPFVQVGLPSDQQARGTGLGLSICKQLVTLMGGDIELHSTPGQGTRVVMKLPIPQVAPPPDADTSAAVLSPAGKLRVLVVDDLSANRLVLSQQLAFLGHQVQAVGSGQEALAVRKGQALDLVITDCNMPGMSGYALAQALRQLEADSGVARLPIIGCSANAFDDEAERCRLAGMDQLLVKPISLAQLEQVLASLARPPAFDIQTLQRMTQADQAALRRMLVELQKNLADETLALEAAVQGCDWSSMRASLHRLKGVACLIDAAPMARASAQLDSSAKARRADSVPVQWASLKTRLQALTADIEKQLWETSYKD